MSYKKFLSVLGSIILAATLTFTACGTGTSSTSTTSDTKAAISISSTASLSAIDTSSMFTDRDLSGEYDESEAETITLSDSGSSSTSKNVTVEGSTVTITAEGTYILSGSLSDGQIVVNAPEDAKVQLVLNGVTISNDSSACIYSLQADKVFVTTAKGSSNHLAVTGEYVAIDDNDIDAVIFSKTDIVLNGTGSLEITAKYGHGVVSKDDLKVCGGTYNITAEKHGLSGKDSVRIADGDINITSGKDGVHSGNEDDDTVGYTYIAGGNITINAEDDGIHSDTLLQIDDGTVAIAKSYEGIEGQTIIVNGGDVDVTSDDDGFNASSGNSSNGEGNDSRENPVTNNGSTDGNSGDDYASSGEDDLTTVENVTDVVAAGENDSTDSDSSADTSLDTARGGHGGFPGGGNGNFPGRPGENSDDSSGNSEDSNRPQRPDGDFNGERPERPDSDSSSDSDSDRQFGGHGGFSGGGGMMDADESCSLTINGGTITVNSSGDGLDSNGTLTVNGGTVYVSGPANDGNGALDSGTEAVINGGIVIAAGSSGMAESFSSNSTQGSILVTSQTAQSGEVKLLDESGNVLASFTPSKQYSCVVVSTADVKTGGTYTVVMGSEEQTVTLDSIVYGESNGFGNFKR